MSPGEKSRAAQWRLQRKRRDVRVFFAAGAIWQLCTDAYWLLLFVRVVTDLQLRPAELLLLGTAKEISILISEVPTGIVADVVSRKRSVWLAFMLSGAGMILAGMANGFWPMALAQLVWGCGSTFRSGAELAWITDEFATAPAEHGRVSEVVLRRSQWTMGAGIVGVGGAAVLSLVAPLGTTLVIVGALMIASGLMLIRLMPEHNFRAIEGAGRARYLHTWRAARGVLREAPSLRWQLRALVVAGVASEAIDRLQVRRLNEIGFPGNLSEVVVIGALGIIDAMLGIALIRLVRRRMHGPSTALFCAALMAVTGLGVAIVGAAPFFTGAAIGVVLQGGMRAATSTAHLVWTNEFAPSSSRATVLSFAGQAQSLGEISGGALFGVVTSVATLTVALLGSAAVYVLAAVFALIGARRWPTGGLGRPTGH